MESELHMHENIRLVIAAFLLAAGASARADSVARTELERLQFALSHFDPSDMSAPSITLTAPSSTIEIRIGENYASQGGDPLHTVSRPGLLVPFSSLVSGVSAYGFGTLDSDPSNPGNTMASNAYAGWRDGGLRPYSYVKSGVSTAFVLSPDTRLEITAYTNVGGVLSGDSGDATSIAGLEVFSADADGEPLDRVASQFSTVQFSGHDRLGGYAQFFTIDFDNTGTQAIHGYFDGYALSTVDSAPPGLVPIPEPANVLLLLASLGVFRAMRVGRCQHH